MDVSPEMASNAIRFFERAFEKVPAVPSALSRTGLTASEVRQALERARPLSPKETQRALARTIKKGSVGRGGLPAYVVKAMYQDYLELKSLAKVAALYGRTRQSMFQILKSHGCQLQEKKLHRKLVYGGVSYTFSNSDRHRYWRATFGDRHPLHRRIWLEAGRTIPEGCEIAFRDGQGTNYSIDNLELVRKGDAARRSTKERHAA